MRKKKSTRIGESKKIHGLWLSRVAKIAFSQNTFKLKKWERKHEKKIIIYFIWEFAEDLCIRKFLKKQKKNNENETGTENDQSENTQKHKS